MSTIKKHIELSKDPNILKKMHTTLNITGPRSIGYFYNDTNKKKIIVITDEHGSFEHGCKQQSYEIADYLSYLFNTKVQIDMFIEKYIPEKYDLLNPNNLQQYIDIEHGYIDSISNLSFDKYKKDPSKKLHFADIRDDIAGYSKFAVLHYNFKLLNAIKELKENTEQNLFKYLEQFILEYTDTLVLLHQKLITKNFDFNVKLPARLLKLLSSSSDEIINKLIPITIKYIKKYLDMVLIPTGELGKFKKPEISIDNFKLINDIYISGMDANAAITDLYTILRIMKSEERKNNILYVGSAHFIGITDYLTSLGFEIIYHTMSTPPDIRCVKDAMPFLTFFNDE